MLRSKYILCFFLDGNTALFLAIDKNDGQAVSLLCSKGANINEVHPKNGFVPLRSAIEKQHVAIVKYLLSLPKIVVTIEDFNNITPLTAAIQKECSKELKDIILKYMVSQVEEVSYHIL